jgi:ubiquitin
LLLVQREDCCARIIIVGDECVKQFLAEGALFVMPVTIDDTNGGDAQVPEKFKAVHFTRLPGGEVTPEFARRLKDLLAGRNG